MLFLFLFPLPLFQHHLQLLSALYHSSTFISVVTLDIRHFPFYDLGLAFVGNAFEEGYKWCHANSSINIHSGYLREPLVNGGIKRTMNVTDLQRCQVQKRPVSQGLQWLLILSILSHRSVDAVKLLDVTPVL